MAKADRELAKLEREQTLADLKWWQETFKPFGISITGWSYRHSAIIYADGHALQIPGWYARKLRKFLKLSDEA